tara:strand:+ start:2251 stop:2535 length:285 start_codon:yes stop_codon:yes gene_type:complete
MKQDILDMLNQYYEAYKEDYISMFGEESNNYLFIDSDLELHIEQENKHHIFVSLFELAKKYNWEEKVNDFVERNRHCNTCECSPEFLREELGNA